MSKKVSGPYRRLPIWPLVIAAIGSAVVGVLAARTDYSFGPHEATYQVTTDGAITVDLGPLGSVVIDTADIAQLGGRTGPLGMHITVHEIPSALKLGSAGDVRDLLAGDLAAYAQLFADPTSTVAIVLKRLALSAARYAGLTWLATASVYMAGYLLLGPQRRRGLARSLRRNWGWAAAGLALTVIVGVGAVLVQPRQAAAKEEPLSALADTPLKGARVTGRLGGVLQTYGGMAVEAWEKNEKFYTTASAEMREALSHVPATPDGTTPVLMVSDLHCNVGMFPVTGATAEALGAKLVINGGDTTASGTSVESYCVDSLVRALPKGSQMVVASGNHDSVETDSQQKAAGMIVLQGEPVTVQGLTFLGDSDPRFTGLGTGTVQKGEETIYDVGERLAQTAAKDPGDIDVLLIHDPVGARQTLERGLAPLALSGHLHKRIGPAQYGKGVMYVSSSTGRGVEQKTTIGALQDDSELTVFYFDMETKRARYYRILTVTKEASVRIGPLLSMPVVRDASEFEGGMTPWPTESADATPLPGSGEQEGTPAPPQSPVPPQPVPLETIPEGNIEN